MKWIDQLRCWRHHAWEFDGGKWVIKDVSLTTRKCKRCGLKQDIEHYHLLPNYTQGECGHGVSMLNKERRPGDADYNTKFEMNERPK
jgi:hypothetical protein